MLRATRVVLALVLATTIARAQDVFDLPWRISAEGQLEVQQLGDCTGAKELQFGAWVPLFPGLFEHRPVVRDDLAWLTAWGPMLALPLLVHGDGGAAAIDEATRRLRKLGIPTTIGGVALKQLQRNPWHDLLYVRHLEAIDVLQVTNTLGDFAGDEKGDPFVRAAAAAALTGRAGAEHYAEDVAKLRPARRGAGALHAGLAALPDDVDLMIGVHTAALPSAAPLLAAWRLATLRFASSVMVSAGGSISPAQYSEAQFIMDRPGQLPFELARRFGNWRVDLLLLALRTGEHDHWWLHAGGLFQPERIAEGLRAGNFDVRTATEAEVQATVHGFVVRATKTEVEAWPEGFDPGRRGGHVPMQHDRIGDAPVWAFMPATSRFAAKLGAPQQTLDARFDPWTGRGSAILTCADDAAAAKLLASWLAWQAQRSCDDEQKVGAREDNPTTWGDVAGLPLGCGEPEVMRLAWRRCVQAVRAQRDGAAVRWTLDVSPFPLVDLARLLGCSPAALIEGG